MRQEAGVYWQHFEEIQKKNLEMSKRIQGMEEKLKKKKMEAQLFWDQLRHNKEDRQAETMVADAEIAA